MSKLSKQLQALAVADFAERARGYAAPYEALVREIALATAATATHADKAKEEKANTWGAFKRALAVAASSGHTVTALRTGMEVACDDAKIPSGSYRSYVNTVAQLYGDIMGGELTLADAEKLSIADARKRYRQVTPEQAAMQKLVDAVKGWTADEISQAAAMLAAEDTEEETIEEVVAAATTHAIAREQQKLAA